MRDEMKKILRKVTEGKNVNISEDSTPEEITKVLLQSREENLQMWAEHYVVHADQDNLLTELTKRTNFLMNSQKDHSKFQSELNEVENKVQKIETTVNGIEKEMKRISKFFDEEEDRRTEELNGLHSNLNQLQKNKIHSWWQTIAVIVGIMASLLTGYLGMNSANNNRFDTLKCDIESRLNTTETKVNSLYQYFIEGKLRDVAPKDKNKTLKRW